jgi:uncharacterized protein YnzC (UPF0291/DUF896 family)
MELNLNRLQELYEQEENITHAAKKYCKENDLEYTDSFRRKVSSKLHKIGVIDDDIENGTETKTNQYKDKDSPKIFTAVNSEGKMMSIEEYCKHYGLDLDKIKSWKLVSHTGIPFYNIAFYESVFEPVVTEEELKSLIQEGLQNIKYTPKIQLSKTVKTGVVKISDLHLGSYIEGLIRTKDFSIDILANKLQKAAHQINERGYGKVHIHLQGDIIESFTGLNHKNSWKGLDKAMVGAEAVKLSCKILHKDFLQRIENLEDIKLVAGNHDRTTSDNKEDVQGDAANLIGWGLELMGYIVEFNPLVLTHEVDGICHIITHGHHGISKKSTKQLCWDYGVQGKFNLISEGHLHSIIEKLSIKQKESFQVIKDDAVDHRRMNCPSFFTGNFFSEALGYTSQSGFVIVEDNGEGIPNVFYYAV